MYTFETRYLEFNNTSAIYRYFFFFFRFEIKRFVSNRFFFFSFLARSLNYFFFLFWPTSIAPRFNLEILRVVSKTNKSNSNRVRSRDHKGCRRWKNTSSQIQLFDTFLILAPVHAREYTASKFLSILALDDVRRWEGWVHVSISSASC